MLVFKNLVLFFIIYSPLNLMAEGMPKKASPFDSLSINSPFSITNHSVEVSIPKPIFYYIDECKKDLSGRPLNSQNMMEIGKIVDYSSCDMADKLTDANRFTPEMCAAQISCTNSMGLENARDTELIAEEIIAYDMKDKINEMNEVNKLRKFAEKKYPDLDIAEICNREEIFETPIDYGEGEAHECKMSVVNNAFRMSQYKCVIGSVNCFPELDNFKTAPENEGNLFESYFLEKTDKYISTTLKNDDLILDTIASIFANVETSNDEKMQATYDHLQKKSLVLDPVLSELMKGFSSMKSSQTFDRALREIIETSKMSTMNEIKHKIDNFRFEETKKILSKRCQEVHTVAQFCKTGKDLTSGAEVQANREQIIETTKTRKNANWLLLPKEKKTIQDANRCTTFGLGGPFVLANGRSTGKLPNFSILETNIDKLDAVNDLVRSSVSGKKKVQYIMNSKGNITNTSKPDIRDLRRVKKSTYASSDNKNISFKAPTAPGVATPLPITAVTPNAPERVPAPLGKVAANIIQPTINANSFSIMNGSDLGVAGNLPKIQNSNTSNSSSYIASENNKELNDQIKALTKKLNSNENRLAKISAEKLEKSENDLKEKNTEKDSVQNEKSEKISDMKKELAELTQKQQAQHSAKLKDSAPSEEGSAALASSEATTSGTSLSSNAPSAAPEKNNFAESVASSSGSSGPSESSSGSSGFRPPSATSAATSGSAHAQAGATLVLGKSDGAEVIANKIMELQNGESFFIEEDGKFKEIFPIMNGKNFVLDANGKPRFEKIEICDGEDKKCIEAKLQAKVKIKKTKPPEVKISSVADLVKNQDEKLKYERVEYLKLKALTKKTIEKAKK